MNQKDREEFARLFKAAYVRHYDQNLTRIEDTDPALAALIDNRRIDDIPI